MTGLALAQPSPPPTDAPDGKRRVIIKLSPEGELLAEDYLFLLEQLDLLTSDYASYFSEMQTEGGLKCLANLNEINRRLRDTATYAGYLQMAGYLDEWQERLSEHEEMLSDSDEESKEEWLEDLNLLDEEIIDVKENASELRAEVRALREEIRRSYGDDSDLTDELEEIVHELKDAKVELNQLQHDRVKLAKEYQNLHEDHRVTRLANGLQREVAVLQEMFQESVVENLEDNEELAMRIEARVKQAIAERLASLPQQYYDIHGVAGDSSPGQVNVIALPLDIPDIGITTVPSVSEVYVPYVNVGGTQIYMPRPRGGASLMREMSDSVKVSSAALSIIVVNPVGQLDIVGWKHDKVVATCEFEVTADSRRKAEKVLEQLDLRIYERKQSVFVEIVAPELTDPRVTIGHTRVRISAPAVNPLVVKSAAGRASITGFKNGAKISTNNCDLTVDRLSGRVDVVSNMGRVSLTDVTGPMALSNSYQPLELTRCKGDINVKNTYSLVSVIDCSGKVSISNSGPTRVSGFAGMVDVHNSNGLLELEEIDGDVTAFNKLQPMLVRDVAGSATLQNERGIVRAEDISGRLSVSNTYAPIMVRSPGGPVYLVNEKGSIDLALANVLMGSSTVLSQGGSVSLKLGSRPNLLLTVEAVGGSIQSKRPIEIIQDGVTSSARVELGAASHDLAITGANATIVIK